MTIPPNQSDPPNSPKRDRQVESETRFVDPIGNYELGGEDQTDFAYDPSAPLETQPVLGEYQIIEKIGAGGMGQVFRARHRTMQRDVALKILPQKFSNHPHLVERFYLEVRAVAKLMHPNIVTAFDAGCALGVHFLVMELVDGISLSSQLAIEGTLKQDQAVNFLKQAANALSYAHSQGVVHRDIKPSNMMWTRNGTLKILDFGLAHLTQEATTQQSDKHLIGTVEFMSPEQVGQPNLVDHRTDLYSLGASLFYLLTGQSMFSGEPVQIALAHLNKEPPALYEVRSDIDLRLDAVFQKLVAKNPKDRYQDADAIITSLTAMNLLAANPSTQTVSVSKLPHLTFEPPTNRPQGESTSQKGYEAIGIELGMSTTRASHVEAGRNLIEIPVDGDKLSIRNMVWSDDEQIAVGDAASNLRASNPNQIFYGFQRWFGIPLLERTFAGRRVPPEILLAVVLRKVLDASKLRLPQVSHAVVNVPSCYDQLHRQCVMTACRCAGVEPLQLLDRPLAAAIAHLETQKQLNVDSSAVKHFLFVCLQTSAGEASVIHVEKEIARIVTTVGDWKLGLARWHSRIAELLAKRFQEQHGIDVRQDLSSASRLQRSVEMAIDRLGVVQQVELRYEAKQKEIRWVLSREDLLKHCEDLIQELIQFAQQALLSSGVDIKSISDLLLVGDPFSIPQLRDRVRKAVLPKGKMELMSKADLARGAALQARFLMPPIDDTGPRAEMTSIYDLGLVSIDPVRGPSAPKVLIPKGTLLPTHYSRTLRFAAPVSPPASPTQESATSKSPTLQFVESTRLGSVNWHRLGSINPATSFARRPTEDPMQLRLEVDASGILDSKLTWLAANMQLAIPPLSDPPMDSVSVQQWRTWIETLYLCQAE